MRLFDAIAMNHSGKPNWFRWIHGIIVLIFGRAAFYNKINLLSLTKTHMRTENNDAN